MLFTFFVVNKAGGCEFVEVSILCCRPHSPALATPVIYTKDLSPTPRLGGDNEYLRLASTFHGLHAISKQASAA